MEEMQQRIKDLEKRVNELTLVVEGLGVSLYRCGPTLTDQEPLPKGQVPPSSHVIPHYEWPNNFMPILLGSSSSTPSSNSTSSSFNSSSSSQPFTDREVDFWRENR